MAAQAVEQASRTAWGPAIRILRGSVAAGGTLWNDHHRRDARMGIVAFCPHGHRVKVKDSLAGKKGVCPICQTRFRIPGQRVPKLPTARVLSLDAAWAATLPRAVILPLPASEPPAPSPARRSSAPSKAGMPRQPATSMPTAGLPDNPQAGLRDNPQAGSPDNPQAGLRGMHPLIGERPDLAWCVAVPGGSPSPPMTAQEMQAWLDTRLATGEELVWRADWQEWAPIRLVFPEFFG